MEPQITGLRVNLFIQDMPDCVMPLHHLGRPLVEKRNDVEKNGVD